jgi:hypothetical protein
VNSDLLAVFLRLLEVLEQLEIRCMAHGSAACSVHGLVRYTKALDLVVELHPAHADALVRDLNSDFYIDADQVVSSINRGCPFSLVHFKTSLQFDLIPLGQESFDQARFSRRRFENLTVFGPEPIQFAVATPEDIILSKLDWYRQRRGVSEQQWNDVLGVIAVKRDELDYAYLREWAAHLTISDLLEQALAERHGSI